MKKVLWISRHEMTTAQLSDLERIMGVNVELHMQTNLFNVAEGKPVLQTVAERVFSDTDRTLEDGRKK